MDDIDEGIGSNDSCGSHNGCNLNNVLDDLKQMNGQSAICTDTQIKETIMNGVTNIEDSSSDKDNEQSTDKDNEQTENTNTLVNDIEMNNSNVNNTDIKNGDTDDLTKPTKEDKIEAEKTELKTEQNGDEPVECSNDLDNKVESSLKSSSLKEENISSPKINKNESETDNEIELENNLQENDSDKKEINDEANTRKPPFTCKSPFFLNDKVRNSLKGLVNKVKSSPDKKPGSPFGNGSDISSDTEPLNERLKFTETPEETEICATTDTGNVQSNDTSMNLDNTDTKTECASVESLPEDSVRLKKDDHEEIEIEDDEDSLLVGDEVENGTEMEIGSDNEEDLLKMSSDEKFDKPNDMKSNGFDNVDNVDSVMSQFDDDSNSNSNSGKINDIVSFLNQDLNSPLTPKIKDRETTPSSDSVIIEEKEDSVAEKTSKDTINISDSNENSEIVLDDDDDDVIIEGEYKPKEADKSKEIAETKTTEIANEQERKSPSLEKTESTCSARSSPVMDTITENGVEEAEDDNNEAEDDDDDVIFEGETIAAKKSNSDNKSSEMDQSSNDKIPQNTNSDCDKKDETIADEDEVDIEDDDVIFEKEEKAESKPLETDTNKTEDTVEKESILNDKNSSEKEALKSSEPNNSDQSVNNDEGNNKQTNSNSDRKRPAEDKADLLSENVSKRTRLDLGGLIGKLGSRVEPTHIELSDSEDESMSTDTAAEKDLSESEDEGLKKKKDEKYLTITEKELDTLVRTKVKAYLATQRDTVIGPLLQKVKDLQANNSQWKRQVKDLQGKINDVTVLQPKLEKRKAATQALRNITTRNVAVQVDDGKGATEKVLMNLKDKLHGKLYPSTPPRASNLSGTSSGHKSPGSSSINLPPPRGTPPKSAPGLGGLVSPPVGGNGTIRLPIPHSSVVPPVLTAQMPGVSQLGTNFKTPTVKSLLDTTRIQPTVGSSIAGSVSTPPSSVISLVPVQPPRYVTPQQSATSQGYLTLQPTPVRPQQGNMHACPQVLTKTVVAARPNAKIIDLTDDEEKRVITLPPGMMELPNGLKQMLAPGSQLVRSSLPSQNNQPAYQLVFASSATTSIRPGTMVTALPGQPTGHLLQGMGQTSMVGMTSPTTVLTSGTTMARAAATTLPPPYPKTHPAPFPTLPANQPVVNHKPLPPKPSLKISRVSQGIVLSWTMATNDGHLEVSNYQLFAYQETSAQPACGLWKKVGDVKALPLPMACTLTQFQVGNKYHFAVRAMDIYNRVGHFSDPSSIHLTQLTTK